MSRSYKKTPYGVKKHMSNKEREEQQRREQEESVYKGRQVEDERNGFVDMEIDASMFKNNLKKLRKKQ